MIEDGVCGAIGTFLRRGFESPEAPVGGRMTGTAEAQDGREEAYRCCPPAFCIRAQRSRSVAVRLKTSRSAVLSGSVQK